MVFIKNSKSIRGMNSTFAVFLPKSKKKIQIMRLKISGCSWTGQCYIFFCYTININIIVLFSSYYFVGWIFIVLLLSLLFFFCIISVKQSGSSNMLQQTKSITVTSYI